MAFDISVNASKTINALVYFSTQQNKLVIRNEVNDTHYTVEFDRDKVVDTFISYNRHNDTIEIRGCFQRKLILVARLIRRLV